MNGPLLEHGTREDKREPPVPYPRESSLAVAASPGAVRHARLHVRLLLREWGLVATAEAAELVVTELVTNAIRASDTSKGDLPSPPAVQLRVSGDHERILIQVWDASEEMPYRRHPDLEADAGRGLLIVEALSESTGVYRLEGATGKIVWALVRTGSGHPP